MAGRLTTAFDCDSYRDKKAQHFGLRSSDIESATRLTVLFALLLGEQVLPPPMLTIAHSNPRPLAIKPSLSLLRYPNARRPVNQRSR